MTGKPFSSRREKESTIPDKALFIGNGSAATIRRLTDKLEQGDELYEELHEKHDGLKAKIEKAKPTSFSQTSELRIESMTRNLNRQHAKLITLRDELNTLARELKEAKQRGIAGLRPAAIPHRGMIAQHTNEEATTVTYEEASTSINYKPSEPVEFDKGFESAYTQLNNKVKTHIEEEYYKKGYVPKVKVGAYFTIKHKEGHAERAEPFYRFIIINTVLTADEIPLDAPALR